MQIGRITGPDGSIGVESHGGIRAVGAIGLGLGVVVGGEQIASE
jgi:hypothetical protein